MCLLSPHLFTIALEVLATVIREEKEIKASMQDLKSIVEVRHILKKSLSCRIDMLAKWRTKPGVRDVLSLKMQKWCERLNRS